MLFRSLEKIISTSEPIEHLADGFGGAQGPAEGPLWWEEGGYLLFSDIHNNRRMKYQPGSGVSLFREGGRRRSAVISNQVRRAREASFLRLGEFIRRGLRIKPVMKLDSFDLIINLVALGMGVGFVPIRALALYGRKQTLQRLPLGERFVRELVVAVRRHRKTPEHLARFVANVLF